MIDTCECCGQELPADMLAVNALEELAAELRERMEYVLDLARVGRKVAKYERDDTLPHELLVATINAVRGHKVRAYRWKGEPWLDFVAEQMHTLDLPAPPGQR